MSQPFDSRPGFTEAETKAAELLASDGLCLTKDYRAAMYVVSVSMSRIKELVLYQDVFASHYLSEVVEFANLQNT